MNRRRTAWKRAYQRLKKVAPISVFTPLNEAQPAPMNTACYLSGEIIGFSYITECKSVEEFHLLDYNFLPQSVLLALSWAKNLFSDRPKISFSGSIRTVRSTFRREL